MSSPLDGPVDRCICLRETVDGAPTGPRIPHPYCRATVHDCADYDARHAPPPTAVITALAENGWKVTPAVTDTDDRLLAAVLRRARDDQSSAWAIGDDYLAIDAYVTINEEEHAALDRLAR